MFLEPIIDATSLLEFEIMSKHVELSSIVEEPLYLKHVPVSDF